jgi:hypothetical protein
LIRCRFGRCGPAHQPIRLRRRRDTATAGGVFGVDSADGGGWARMSLRQRLGRRGRPTVSWQLRRHQLQLTVGTPLESPQHQRQATGSQASGQLGWARRFGGRGNERAHADDRRSPAASTRDFRGRNLRCRGYGLLDDARYPAASPQLRLFVHSTTPLCGDAASFDGRSEGMGSAGRAR